VASRRLIPSPSGSSALVDADSADEGGRDEERDRIRGERERCRQQLDEGAGERRSAHPRGRAADAELAVRLDDVARRDDEDEQRAVRDVEDDREHADEEGHDEELLEREDVEHRANGNPSEERRSPEVGHDHQPAAPRPAVDPHAREQ
jgi:hypothetical protein